jgi:hypothetical protein
MPEEYVNHHTIIPLEEYPEGELNSSAPEKLTRNVSASTHIQTRAAASSTAIACFGGVVGTQATDRSVTEQDICQTDDSN